MEYKKFLACNIFFIPRKIKHTEKKWFCLLWFYGISTIIGYLMSNPVFTYILDIVNTFCRYTRLNDQTVLLLTIQFNICHLFAHN